MRIYCECLGDAGNEWYFESYIGKYYYLHTLRDVRKLHFTQKGWEIGPTK